MFNVGIFTTHIPYIAILAAYCLYFMVFSYQKHFKSNEETEQKIVEVKDDAKDVKSKSIDYFSAKSEYCKSSAIVDQFKNNISIFSNKNNYLVLNQILKDRYRYCSVLSRPPPSEHSIS